MFNINETVNLYVNSGGLKEAENGKEIREKIAKLPSEQYNVTEVNEQLSIVENMIEAEKEKITGKVEDEFNESLNSYSQTKSVENKLVSTEKNVLFKRIKALFEKIRNVFAKKEVEENNIDEQKESMKNLVKDGIILALKIVDKIVGRGIIADIFEFTEEHRKDFEKAFNIGGGNKNPRKNRNNELSYAR